MSAVRDHVSDIPVRTRIAANRIHVSVSDAWYRAAGRRISGTRTKAGNWRNARAAAAGRRDVLARAADEARSRLPVVRDRISPATGRPHRDDARLGRLTDKSLARSADRSARTAAANRDLITGRQRNSAPARARGRRSR